MKKITILILLMLVFVGAVGYFLGRRLNEGESAEKDARPGAGLEASFPGDVADIAPLDVLPVASADIDGKVQSYLCKSSVCKGDPVYAKSDEEAAWMLRNGFPSPEEMALWKNMSESQLKALADNGSLAAMAMYGERLAERDYSAGLDILQKAANAGSIYSYYGTSKLIARNNRLDGAAFMRVAYLLGDSRASERLMTEFPKLNPLEYAAIDRRATELYRTYAHERKPSPRP